MKRFSETDKWTKDRWFSNLEPRHKLFWMYLIDHCDNVGVWEVHLRMATLLIGYEYSMDTLCKAFAEKIHVFDNGNKWWIRSFIDFQHGLLSEDSGSKPIISYIALLKKHRLWIPYTKGTQGVQGKGKGKGNTIKGDCKGADKGAIAEAKTAISESYGRRDTTEWTAREKKMLSDLAKRVEFETELKSLLAHRKQRVSKGEGQYFSKSVATFLSSWVSNLDAIKSHAVADATQPQKITSHSLG